MSDDALPLCACVQYYDSHHPECPARRAYEVLASRLGAVEAAFDPRQWTNEQSDAWHRHIPDVQAAFTALREASLVCRFLRADCLSALVELAIYSTPRRETRMARECITHHHACDCREERFRELEAENERLRTKLETSQVALKGAEERAKMLLDAKNHWAERARTAESRLGTLQSERDGAFALIYELMRDEHFIHGRDSWFKRAHELCGDVCTPGIHAFNSEDAELCQCGQRRADGSVVERHVQLCEHGEGLTDYCLPCGRVNGGG